MIHWLYPNGELTWQAALILFALLFIFAAVALLTYIYRRDNRRPVRSTTRIYKGLYR